MVDQNREPPKGGLASLSPEAVDQLCDLIIAKLEGRDPRGLASQPSTPA